MIYGIEGIPGSGKSYEAVAIHVLAALKDGRRVITNLPLNVEAFMAIDPAYKDLIEIRTRPAKIIGDWDATDIAARPAFQLWTDRPPEDPPPAIFTFGTVWDFYTTWRSASDQGPLYVIDECHVSFPKLGTPDSVVQWFKLHRHFNADVLLMTQSFRDINQPIASLLSTLVKVRKADILGQADHYIRNVHAGYRGAMISTEKRKYKPEYFKLYRSNTQSKGSAEAAAQDVSPFNVKFRRFTRIFWALAIPYVIYAFWPQDDRNVFGVKTNVRPLAQQVHQVEPAASESPASESPAGERRHASRRSEQPRQSEPEEKKPQTKDPLFGKVLHLTGGIQMAGKQVVSFVVSSEGRRVFDLTDNELREAGYEVKMLSSCMATVVYRDVMRPVTCDAPAMAQGGDNRPVVIDTATGARSDRRS